MRIPFIALCLGLALLAVFDPFAAPEPRASDPRLADATNLTGPDVDGALALARDGTGALYASVFDGRIVRVGDGAEADAAGRMRASAPVVAMAHAHGSVFGLGLDDGRLVGLQAQRETPLQVGVSHRWIGGIQHRPGVGTLYSQPDATRTLDDFWAAVHEDRPTGGVYQHSGLTQPAQVMAADLQVPVGLTIAGHAILVAEAGARRIVRIDLAPPHTRTTVADALPAAPFAVTTDPAGLVWVTLRAPAQASRRHVRRWARPLVDAIFGVPMPASECTWLIALRPGSDAPASTVGELVDCSDRAFGPLTAISATADAVVASGPRAGGVWRWPRAVLLSDPNAAGDATVRSRFPDPG